jgi:hypothetical protein
MKSCPQSLEADACTLRPQDACAEVQTRLNHDAELSTWVANRRDFDERIAAAMDDVPVCEVLHRKILAAAGMPMVQRPKLVMPPVVKLFAMAAALVLLAGGSWWMLAISGGWEREALARVSLVHYGLDRIDHREPSLGPLREWLTALGTVSPSALPAGLEEKPTYGCTCIRIGGKEACIVCFKLPSGKTAHLVVTKDADAPLALATPVFGDISGWHTVKWSAAGQTFLLASAGAEDELRTLFAQG